MLYRKLILSTAVTCLAIGVAGFEHKVLGQDKLRADPTKQTPPQNEAIGDQVNRLIQTATNALSEGDYESAFAQSAEICKLKPDNMSFLMFRGRVCFAAGKMKACIEAYDQAIRLRPFIEPQLWQRGLALYYAQRYQDGVKQFETHQTVNSQDVENAVWHLLCAARVSDVDKARKKLIPITGDTRVPMSQIYEMFAGRMKPDDVLASAREISNRIQPGSDQQKLQLYYAHLYTGLYHEMLQDPQSATASLKKAVEINPFDNTNFMGQVARVHLKLRQSTQPENK